MPAPHQFDTATCSKYQSNWFYALAHNQPAELISSRCPDLSSYSSLVHLPHVKVNAQTGISTWTGGFNPPISFPQWVIAAGPNKEKEMWFNGVHKSAFPCCQVRAAHAPSPAPPRVCNLVKLQCFQSCLLWELWFLMSSSTVVFRSRLLLGNVYILFYPDWRGPGLMCQHWQAEGDGGGGPRLSVFAVLHQSTEGSTSLGTNGYHMFCLLGWNQAHYGVNCLEPTELP